MGSPMSIMSIRRIAKRLLAPVIIVLVVAMMVGVFYIGFPSMNKESLTYVGPSIKVNGQRVKDVDFNNYMMQAAQQANQYGMSLSEDQIRDGAVTMAMRDLAFQQEIKKVESKLKVKNSDVDDFIKKYFPTEEEIQSIMQRQNFSSKNELKKAIYRQLELEKFVLYKARQFKITVSKAEILAAMEQIQVSHILIGLKDANSKPRSDAAALQLANEVYKKATSGGDFAQLAQQYSDDPGSKSKGGSIGQMPLDQFKKSMDQNFVTGALALKNGQISKPVKTQFGYHIIRLDSLGVPTGSEYKEKYQLVRDSLLFEKAQNSPLLQDWLQRVYTKAQNNLEIIDPGLRAFRLKEEQKLEESAAAYQKALRKGYYKSRIATYIDASEVYLQLKKPKDAIAVLKKAPAAQIDFIDYQIALANAYKAENQNGKALDILAKYVVTHNDDIQVHSRLKEIYTEWNEKDLAAKEDKIITDMQQAEKEKEQKYQDSLNQQNTKLQPTQQTKPTPQQQVGTKTTPAAKQ